MAAKSTGGDPAKAEPKTTAADKEKQEKQEKEHPESAYSASAVIFFTRKSDDSVDKVLMAVEERKVQASYIGLPQKGKIIQKMLLFPMGRRERKDKGDTVETAKREYVEETGDYGSLSRYLDFADFTGGGEAAAAAEAAAASLPEGKIPRIWTGKKNMAVYFKAAGMINLFCEVPPSAATKENRAAQGGVNLKERAKEEAEAAKKAAEEAEKEAAAAAAAEEEGPKKKKRKKAAQPKADPTYSVGKTDHLIPIWVDAQKLRDALESGERSAAMTVLVGDGKMLETRLYPTAASVLRLAEARAWLGLSPPTRAKAENEGGAAKKEEKKEGAGAAA